MTKQELRIAIKAKKLAMAPDDIALRSRQLCHLILSSPAYHDAATIYGYLPFNQEVNLLPLLQQALADGKQIALPKCRGSEMHFIFMTDFSRVQYTRSGVPEPLDDSPLAWDQTALVLVPGLAFDRRGYRVGYGGGYYDRFLAREPDHPTIALCYDFQLVNQIPSDPLDFPVQHIFSV